jgi:hypothetical protein
MLRNSAKGNWFLSTMGTNESLRGDPAIQRCYRAAIAATMAWFVAQLVWLADTRSLAMGGHGVIEC